MISLTSYELLQGAVEALCCICTAAGALLSYLLLGR